MKFIDLFSGLGGFRLGFQDYGKCVFSSDIDKFVSKTYHDNFNENPLNDITKQNEKEIPAFDILCAGFPCQPFSIAGYRRGFSDTRGTLFFDIERILRHHKPKAFILENVKGLVNHDEGRTLSIILNKLSTTINGVNNIERDKDCLNYNVFFKVLNSRNFGLPQNRERIFIIGFKNEAVNFSFDNKKKETKLLDVIDKNFSKDLKVNPHVRSQIEFHLNNRKDFHDIKDIESLLAYEIRKSRCSFRFDNLSPTLTAKMGTGGNNVPVLVQKMRKFSVKECLSIQGFPDWYKIDQTSQGYKQVGNSVSVPLIKALSKKIVELI